MSKEDEGGGYPEWGPNPEVLFVTSLLAVTSGVLAMLEEDPKADVADVLFLLLARHCAGDWGDLDDHDAMMNDRAYIIGGRVFSTYDVGARERVWIITEGDRSVTTVLLPSEY